MVDFASARDAMVDTQLRTNDVSDLRIQGAMGQVPRERFVPAERRTIAYMSESLPLVQGRALMDPRSLGKLLQMADITPEDLVLVVGAATGYTAAVAAQLAGAVVALESDEDLARTAHQVLADLGIDNAAVVEGPLAQGYPAQGPYDVIVMDGAVSDIPEALLTQLKIGGRLVAILQNGPVGKGTMFVRSPRGFSQWIGFDATVAPLPGFARRPGFVF